MPVPSDADTVLVILGAGASHDCFPSSVMRRDRPVRVGSVSVPLDDARPPLTKDIIAGNDVVNTILGDYRKARPLMRALRDGLGEDDQTLSLEQALRKYINGSSTDPTRLNHLMAFRFFLRDLLTQTGDAMLSPLLDSDTNYTRLVGIFYRWANQNDKHACFVSFNYDTLLDTACEDQAWGFDMWNLDTYVRHKNAAVLKPHGSVHWYRRIEHPGTPSQLSDLANFIISHAHEIDTERGTLEPFNWNTWSPDGHRLPMWIPALAMPIADKTELVWPKSQGDHLISHGGRVSEVFAIGWRAAEATFVDLIGNLVPPDALINIVTGGNNALEEFEQIRRKFRDVGLRHIVQYELGGFGKMFARLNASYRAQW